MAVIVAVLLGVLVAALTGNVIKTMQQYSLAVVIACVWLVATVSGYNDFAWYYWIGIISVLIVTGGSPRNDHYDAQP